MKLLSFFNKILTPVSFQNSFNFSKKRNSSNVISTDILNVIFLMIAESGTCLNKELYHNILNFSLTCHSWYQVVKNLQLDTYSCFTTILKISYLQFKQLPMYEVSNPASNKYPLAKPIHVSFNSKQSYTQVLQCLSHYPAYKKNHLIMTAFYEAIENKHYEVVCLLLLDPRVDPSANQNAAIIDACIKGTLAIVQILLADSRVNPSDQENLAIRMASYKGYTEIVKCLLKDPRVNPSDQNNSALQGACEYGRTEIVRRLLEDPRVKASEIFYDSLYIACTMKYLEIAHLLLANKHFDPSIKDNCFIKDAAKHGNIELVQLLIKDPRINLNTYPRAAQLAHMEGHIEIEHLILEEWSRKNKI